MSASSVGHLVDPTLVAAARLVDPGFYAGDPFPVYARLRAEAPVFWCEEGQFWAVSKYEDVRRVGHDAALFSSRRGTLLSEGRARDVGGPHLPGARHLMRTDPPAHGPMRKIVSRSFSPRFVTAIEERARVIARDLVADIRPGAVTDVVAALSAPLTTYVIAELMGVPRERWADFWDWTDNAIRQVDAGRDDPGPAAKVGQLMEFFDELLAERRRRPGDDVVTDLISGELDGEPLTGPDLLTYCKFLLVAGTETTRNLISSGVELLAAHPAQRRLLVADPSLLPGAVEEMLRLSSPVLAFCRTATADTEIRGQPIRAGDYVAMLYASANRDEEVWADSGRFDVTRTQERPHVAFGFGPHVCLGAALARMEARVAFDELLAAYPDFEVTGPAVRGPSTLVAMVVELPAVFTPAAPAPAGVAAVAGPAAPPEIDGDRPDDGPTVVVRGPSFEDLWVGQVFDAAPPVTLTDGLAAAHQAIVGDRLRLGLSRHLAAGILGTGPVAPPALVWNLSIGQSSQVTQHVRANLFYRGLRFHRLPLLGDTLATSTRIVGLRQNTPRPGRPATGLAALRITTVDQDGNRVLDYLRCAMIPLRDPAARTGHRDELDRLGPAVSEADLDAVTANWRIPAGGPAAPVAGTRLRVEGRDLVSSAPELARLTMNIAAVHHDAAAAGGQRLVYGGHTIAIALAQAARAIPALLTVLAWRSCDHLAPVHEGDLLSSEVEVEQVTPLAGGGYRLDLRSRVWAAAAGPGAASAVLDWRYVAISG